MTRLTSFTICMAAISVGAIAANLLAAAPMKGARPAVAHAHEQLTPAEQNTLVATHCATCHDDEMKTGGLSLQDFDAESVDRTPEIAEKMIHKLRTGMMPPASVKDRPATAALQAFAASLEAKMDSAAAVAPNPGSRPFQRLNRPSTPARSTISSISMSTSTRFCHRTR